jgi:hypothetical protein
MHATKSQMCATTFEHPPETLVDVNRINPKARRELVSLSTMRVASMSSCSPGPYGNTSLYTKKPFELKVELRLGLGLQVLSKTG